MEKNICGICLDNLDSTDNCLSNYTKENVNLFCQHEFHEHCLWEWFSKSLTCPICRSHIDNETKKKYETSLNINAQDTRITPTHNVNINIEYNSTSPNYNVSNLENNNCCSSCFSTKEGVIFITFVSFIFLVLMITPISIAYTMDKQE